MTFVIWALLDTVMEFRMGRSVMKRSMLAVLLVLAVEVSIGCNRTKDEVKVEPLSVNNKAEEQASQQTRQEVLPAKSVSVQTDAERPIFQWAGMVAIGDDIAQVNEALKLAHYPPLDCSPNRFKSIATTCHTANDGGLFTANLDDDGRLLSLEDAAKDPERTNYRTFKSAMTPLLGAPRIDRNKGIAYLTWHQREDGSKVTLFWFNGSYCLSMRSKSLPEG
jgi:hypothetical protein